MANQPRQPMTTANEIIEWAEKTRDANGEAFTMLNKVDQLSIAKFILEMRDYIKALKNGNAKEPKTPPATEQTKEPEIIERKPEQDKRQTNMEFFKSNRVGMQRAYELFTVWQDCDPTNRMILDNKRKAYINSAAFAFWLNLPHE